jgi:sialic acid synthase SpsE
VTQNAYFGHGRRCFVVAEIGANHGGDIELCLRTMDAAAACGVDALKLQYYTAAELVADVDRVWAWGPEGGRVEERIGDMFDRLALTKAELQRAFAHADGLRIPLFCTPFSPRGVADLEELGNPIYKVASSDLSHSPMLEAIDRLRKPIIVSTGKAPLEDVDAAVETLRHSPREDVALLHCIAEYPAPTEQMNVRVIASFQQRFPGHPVGLSDHAMTDEPALAAVALGACVLEKHFTLDRELSGPDHWFSMDPERMRRLVESLRRLEQSLGDGEKGIADCEQWEAAHSRRSIIVMKPIAPGEVVSEEHLALLRPGSGLHPRHWGAVIGRRALVAIEPRQPLRWEMLEGEPPPDAR